MADELAAFIRDLPALAATGHGQTGLVERIKPYVQRLAAARSWVRPQFYDCNAAQGFGVTELHEERDRSLWLVAVSWLPGRGAPPHNHGTWAVIAGVDGQEKNILWRRRGGRLEQQGIETIGPRQVTSFLGDAIHSVTNEGPHTTLSLHLYGKNLSFVERSQFDPDTGAEKPFTVQVR